MLDFDLAELYEVETRVLNQAVVYDPINYLLLKDKKLSAHRQRRPIGYRTSESD